MNTERKKESRKIYWIPDVGNSDTGKFLVLSRDFDREFEIALKKLEGGPQQPSKVKTICNLVDLLPNPTTRKVLRKLLADQDAHLRDLLAEGRVYSARVAYFTTWLWVLCYLFTAPIKIGFKLWRGTKETGDRYL